MEPEKKTFAQLFFDWKKTDILQALMFLGWVGCVSFVLSGDHLIVGLSVGLVVAVNYAFLAVYHVNSTGTTGPERVKYVGLIFLAPSVFMGILAILSLITPGGVRH